MSLCTKVGIDYNQMLKLTLKEVETISEAQLDVKIENMNTDLHIAHETAALVAIGVNSPKKFPKKIKEIKKPKKKKNKKEVADPDEIYNKIWQISAMCGKPLQQ